MEFNETLHEWSMVRGTNASRFPNLLAHSSAPCWPFFILNFYFFLLIIKTVWHNSMKLHINDRLEKTQTPACFRTSSPNVAPPGGHSYFKSLTFLCLCSKLFDGFQRNFTQIVDGGIRLQQLIFENVRPQQRPWWPFLLYFRPFWNLLNANNLETVWWNWTKLNKVVRQDEPLTSANLCTCWSTTAPPGGHFYFIFGHFEICEMLTTWKPFDGIQRILTKLIDRMSC